MIAAAPEVRHRLGLIGVIFPEALYTTEAIRDVLGIGERKLVKAREAGQLKGHFEGRRCYYLGKDIITWLTAKEE